MGGEHLVLTPDGNLDGCRPAGKDIAYSGVDVQSAMVLICQEMGPGQINPGFQIRPMWQPILDFCRDD